MRTLAIDPGYDRCGVAVLEKKSGKETLLVSVCLQTNKEDSFPQRLKAVGDAVESYIKEFSPEEVAIEKLYFNNNQKTAMGVAEARGVIQYLAEKNSIKIYEYTPAQVKIAVTGSGRADKRQVAFMLTKLLHLPDKKRHDDEYDAIGIGLAHLCIRR